eukprot:c11743_g1_i1 orf=98-2068(+)
MQGSCLRSVARLHGARFFDVVYTGAAAAMPVLRGAEYATESFERRSHATSQEAQPLGKMPLGGAGCATESHEHRTIALPQGGQSSKEQLQDIHTKMPLHGFDYATDGCEHRGPAVFQEGQSSGLQMKDSHIVRSICRIMESGVWGPNSEPLLKPYATDLSPEVIAIVILKQRSVSMAKHFFQWSAHGTQHSSHVYHALLIKLGESKLFDEMWQLLHEMKTKGCAVCGTSFSILFKAYGAAGLPCKALSTLDRACEFDVPLDHHVYTTLLGVLFKAKMVTEATSIYNRMVQEKCQFDGSVWSTLIRGFGKSGLTMEAERCWQEMLDSGHEPALIHYNASIEGLCETGALSKALIMLNDLKEKGLTPNAYTYNPFLVAFCRAGKFSEAFGMFGEMKDVCMPNQATFNVLLAGLFLDTDISKAVELYDLLEEQGWVDSRTYFLLANGLRKAKQLDKLISVSEQLHAKHGVVDVSLCNTILHLLCDQSDISRATSFFNRMLDGLTHPDVVSFASMINGYCKSHNFDDAMRLLSGMKDRGLTPNAFCYSPLIAASLKSGRVSDGLFLFEDMVRKRVEPNAVICDFLLRKLSEARMVDESLWVLTHIAKRRFHVHASTVAALMTCLQKEGRHEKAREVLAAMEKHGCLVNGGPLEKALKVLQ